MEEDIKKIEQLIARCDNCNLKECTECGIVWNDVQSIENLIKGYKEKEERNIYLVNERKKLEELLYVSNENYIEKSVIKDKLEELEKERQKIESSPYDKWDLYKVIGKIEVLEEF
jgi:hypothetical protein